MFFVMLVTVGIDSVFGSVDTTVTISHGMFKKMFRRGELKRDYVTIGYCVFCFLFGMLFVTEGGIHIFELFDHYAAGLNFFVFMLMQTFVFSWVFGFDRLDAMARRYTGAGLPRYYRFSARYLCPILLIVILIISFVSELGNPNDFPPGA